MPLECNSTILKRHTLLDISDSGRQRILAELYESSPHDDTLKHAYARVVLADQTGARIPCIVRRDEESQRPGLIPVGFSSPTCSDAGRLRIAAFARFEEVCRVTSPYDLISDGASPPRNACTTALELCKVQARSLGLTLGVWGSAALELYTGLQYTHAGSDLDLLVGPGPQEALSVFFRRLTAVEAHLGLRIDVEVDLANGYGVHLKELFGDGRMIIGKSQTDVTLLPREQVLAELPQEGPVSSQVAVGGCNG